MTAFLFAMIAVLLAGLGARDQVTLANLSISQGSRPALLVVALATACAVSALAAWFATAIAPMLQPNARLFYAGLALVFAAGESLLLSPGRKPEEPTRSLFATGIVLLAHQLTDAARFLVFAFAVATAAPVPAGIGGAMGSAIMLTSAWAAPELFDWRRLRPVRRTIGLLLALLGVFVCLRAMGRI